MFTGLVQELGRVAALERGTDGARITISAELAGEVAQGDSVAVNGVCLTATEVSDDGFAAEAMHETLRRSSLGDLDVGSRVNLELAMKMDDRFGGHFVQGHVDGVGEIAEIAEDGFSRVVRITAPPELLRYTVDKGSITVDGVSLTVSESADAELSVSLIPETLERTTLGQAAVGTRVNLEVDVLAKYVERLLGARV